MLFWLLLRQSNGVAVVLEGTICLTFYVSAEPRTFTVPRESRTFAVAAEPRTFVVGSEPRTFYAPCCEG